MKILYLGPSCPAIEAHLTDAGHAIFRTEKKISLAFLQEQDFDFCISYRYKEIIKKAELDYFGKKIINLHISFLPFNRGSDPNFWSYIENTPQGVSIHIMDEGIDTGSILLQKKVDMDIETDTLKSSYEKLSNAIESLFIQNSEQILKREILPVPQERKGKYHHSRDKNKWLYLMEQKWWDTPIKEIVERERERERERSPKITYAYKKDKTNAS